MNKLSPPPFLHSLHCVSPSTCSAEVSLSNTLQHAVRLNLCSSDLLGSERRVSLRGINRVSPCYYYKKRAALACICAPSTVAHAAFQDLLSCGQRPRFQTPGTLTYTRRPAACHSKRIQRIRTAALPPRHSQPQFAGILRTYMFDVPQGNSSDTEKTGTEMAALLLKGDGLCALLRTANLRGGKRERSHWIHVHSNRSCFVPQARIFK
ncbi:hypothetical protein NQZ68_031391 [Dissostichus eleginoides]|nr:hypothetical protein NQZ68_031391 [Dissostichus eleginoides]